MRANGSLQNFLLISINSIICLKFVASSSGRFLLHANIRNQTTIRVLGGLLSAYHLSGGDSLYLEKAVDLADRMIPAFDTPSGRPHAMFNAARREAVSDTENQNLISTAEAGTMQLEFKYLSHLTGNPIYWGKTEKATLDPLPSLLII